jgi:hypothetical protein
VSTLVFLEMSIMHIFLFATLKWDFSLQSFSCFRSSFNFYLFPFIWKNVKTLFGPKCNGWQINTATLRILFFSYTSRLKKRNLLRLAVRECHCRNTRTPVRLDTRLWSWHLPLHKSHQLEINSQSRDYKKTIQKRAACLASRPELCNVRFLKTVF